MFDQKKLDRINFLAKKNKEALSLYFYSFFKIFLAFIFALNP